MSVCLSVCPLFKKLSLADCPPSHTNIAYALSYVKFDILTGYRQRTNGSRNGVFSSYQLGNEKADGL